jgi:hypothetical protein
MPTRFQKRLNIDTKNFYKKDYNILSHPSPKKGEFYKTATFKEIVQHHDEAYHHKHKITKQYWEEKAKKVYKRVNAYKCSL